MTNDTIVLDRKLRRLERLRSMNTSFEVVASSLEGSSSHSDDPLELSPAVQKSMALRRSSISSVDSSSSSCSTFSEKLKLSWDLSRECQTDAKAVLLRLQECSPRALAETLAAQKKRQVKEEEEEKKEVDDGDDVDDDLRSKASSATAADALHNLRGILEEQKRRNTVKRNRLREIKRTNEAAEKGLVVAHSLYSSKSDDVSIITNPSIFAETAEEAAGSLTGLSIELDDIFTVPVITEEETIDFSKDAAPTDTEDGSKGKLGDSATTVTAALSDVSSFDEEASQRSKQVEEMKDRVRTLEEEKMERAATLSSFLADYRSRAERLETENERIQDASYTTYTEMKSLLVEQSQQSDYLRGRLSKLEKHSKNFKAVGKIFLMLFFFVTVGMAFVFNQPTVFPKIQTTWNGLCAPVEPSTQVTEETGPMEAPWWAPEGALKEPLFHMAGCGNRPRLHMEIKRGMLYVKDTKDDAVVMKKASQKVYAEADTIQIVARQRGGHTQMDAPWALDRA